ncbi:MAG: two-component hybrid sensor and regulator [bacterium]|nr:two-component hybrid sensor and regulator [bacterium]
MIAPSRRKTNRLGPSTLQGLRVLVVDDVDLDSKLVRVVLAAEGCDVRTARDTDEAAQLVGTFRPRVIVMDVRLPSVDGLELTERLKASPKTRDIVIVAVTAYSDEKQARAAGCDEFLAKPIDVGTFATRILALIERAPRQQS